MWTEPLWFQQVTIPTLKAPVENIQNIKLKS